MPFHSIVIVREAWDTRDTASKLLDDAGNLRTDLLTTRFDPEDLNALEMALQIKDKHGGKVTALSPGEPRGLDVLKECLYRGADEIVRVVGSAAEDLDTQMEAALLGHAIGKIGAFDLLLAGVSLDEGKGSLLGAHVAGLLGIEAVSWVDRLEEIEPGRVVGRRAVEMGYEFVEASLPAALLVGVALLKEDPRAPRSAKAMLKVKHKKADVPVWTAATLGLPSLAARRTVSLKARVPIPERVIESKAIDPADDSALAGMLDEILGAK